MNGGLTANAALLAALAADWKPDAGHAIAVCVPFPYLGQAQAALTGTPVAWGAQNVSEHQAGAYTGEVAASMLVDFGCRYAIVGHSERRQIYADTDSGVAGKAAALLAVGVTPIVCVGETLAEREAGTTEAVVLRQLDAVLAVTGADARRLVVAYEPVWAIGTGRTATTAQAQDVHATLRARLAAAGCGGHPAALRRQRQGRQRRRIVRDAGHRWRPYRRRVAEGGRISGHRACLTPCRPDRGVAARMESGGPAGRCRRRSNG